MQRRYVMLDRDGTLIAQKHYLSDPAEVELITGVGEALRILCKLGLGLVVITNQSPIGHGYFDEKKLKQIHDRMSELLASEFVSLDAIYYCPHTPSENCGCRKPYHGLAERAAQELCFNLNNAFMVGDKECDIKMGKNVGATTFLVRTGYGADEESCIKEKPDYVVDNLIEAALVIKRLICLETKENISANSNRKNDSNSKKSFDRKLFSKE